jgi:WD40 repeat protein
VAFLDGGKKALVGGGFYLRLLDLTTSKELKMFPSNKAPIGCLAITADGKWAVTGANDGVVRLWDLEAFTEVKTFTADQVGVGCVAFSPDGKKVAAGFHYFINKDRTTKGGNVVVWDVQSGKETHRLECRVTVGSVLFSADGKQLLASCFRDNLRVWDLATKAEAKGTGGSAFGFARLALVGPRQVLMGGPRSDLRLWDIPDAREVRSFPGHTGPIYSVAASTDGTRALSGGGGPIVRNGKVVSQDCTLRVWDVAGGQELGRFEQPTDSVQSVALSPDGTHALSGGSRGTVRYWDLTKIKAAQPAKPPDSPPAEPFTGHEGTITCVAWAPGGKMLLTGGEDSTARLWEVATGKQLRKIDLGQPVRRVAFTRTGAWLAVTGDKRTGLVQDIDGKVTHQLVLPRATRRGPDEASRVRAFAFTYIDDRVYAAIHDQLIFTAFKTQTFKPVSDGRFGEVQALALASDGKRLAVGNHAGAVAIWDVDHGKILVAYKAHEGKVLSVAFHPRPRVVVSGGEDGKVTTRDVSKKVAIPGQFKAHTGPVTGVGFLGGGRYIASCSKDKTVRVLLWNGSDFVPYRHYKGHEAAVNDLACAPDGKRIASVGEAIRIWDISKRENE